MDSKKINWKAYLTGLLSAGTLAFLGGILDFQNIKAEVKNTQKEVKELKSDKEKTDKILKAIGIITCRNAISQKMPNAEEICKEVLN